MPSDFRGVTARYYARYRRDVPDVVVRQLIDHFRLRAGDRVLDLGAGTGQLILPLAGVLGGGTAMDPEPDMLVELRRRARAAELPVLCLLGADSDLGAVADVMGEGTFALLAVANALHWMDAQLVVAQSKRLLRPAGGLAIITHGTPLWLSDPPWARAIRDYLEEWFGRTLSDSCGTDPDARRAREKLLLAEGFESVATLDHEYRAVLTADEVIGGLNSALSPADVPDERRLEFTDGLRMVLDGHPELVQDVSLISLVATRP